MESRGTELTPAEFAYFVLEMTNLYDWQIEGLESIGLQEQGGKHTSVVAANGSGKTSNLVAPAVLWFLSRYPKGQVVVTSGSFRQVEKQLWPAMKVFTNRFPEWSFLQTELKTSDGGFALGFSTDHPGRAEGWHPKQGKEVDPVFIIVDEAKTVPNAIFEAFDRCTRVFQLWVSSPGQPAGEFYESFHSNRKFFWTRKVSSLECPHIDPAKRERDKEKYGESSPLYRSMHLAEFTADVERLVMSPIALRDALEYGREPKRKGEKVAFFDFAAGRDENVFALRVGDYAYIVEAWHESDTMQAVKKFIRLAKELGLQSSDCWGDADGLGKPMLDKFKEENFAINPFHGGLPAEDKDDYLNLVSEVWFKAVRRIERGVVILDKDLDPKTFKQITTRFSEWAENGKLRVESKKDMAKRGVKSPDRADALLGCIMCGSHMSGAVSEEAVNNSTVGSNEFAGDVVEF